MLDDLKYIDQRDKSDALGTASKIWQQYKHSFGFSWQPNRQIKNVVVAGMGGSALAARVISSWPQLKLPYEIVQGYDLPSYVDEGSLVVLLSYSGNTEEVRSVAEQAISVDKKPVIFTVSSGGALADFADRNGLGKVLLPGGLQPRLGFGYQLRALIEVFTSVGLIEGQLDSLTKAADWLGQQSAAWLPEIPVSKNPAKQIALDLVGKTVLIYSGNLFSPAAYKWKISFNESSKNLAWHNVYSEFDHNEIMGWLSHPVDKPFSVVEIHSKFENSRIQKRFEITQKLLSGKRPSPIVIQPEGDSLVEQLLWTTGLGDMVSIYLGLLNGVDPTQVEVIERLKAELGPFDGS
ncbi:MAG TPA: bifunctional phosphoglucose/phosphomannose isomerase [Candidatus Saccharimonadales bacterium]|nr:bifunctional phosphoglucose/phosphomannose isomerase [Candidatus Saccharimonadales bacterium]